MIIDLSSSCKHMCDAHSCIYQLLAIYFHFVCMKNDTVFCVSQYLLPMAQLSKLITSDINIKCIFLLIKEHHLVPSWLNKKVILTFMSCE